MDNSVNQRIKKLREELVLSQLDFSERLGVTAAAIRKIENYNGGLSPKLERKIYEEFGVNPDWLKKGTGEMFVKGKKVPTDNSNYNVMDTLRIAFGKLEGYVIGKYGKEEWSNIQEFFPPNFKVAYPFIQKAS